MRYLLSTLDIWKPICLFAAVCSVGATVTAKLQTADQLANISEYVGQLKSLKFETIVPTYDSKQVDTTKFHNIREIMKTLLKRAALFFALPICTLVNFSLPAAADSTAALILSTKCRGGYDVNIWRTYTSGELLYRSTSRDGDLSLGRGTSHSAEGVRVYRFQNGDYEYWLWDGPDSSRSETLQVYRNNRVLMQQLCKGS